MCVHNFTQSCGPSEETVRLLVEEEEGRVEVVEERETSEDHQQIAVPVRLHTLNNCLPVLH